jgi:hypothetical protein
MGAPVRGRTLTTLAVGCIALDGVLLLIAGIWSRRVGLLVGGGACLAVGLVVVLLWRRYQRAIGEIAQARRDAAREALALGDLLRTGRGGSPP